MEDKQWEQKAKEEGGITMTVETALTIPMEKFIKLTDECSGFNGEVYKNHQVHKKGETIGEFLMKGSDRISENPIIKGNLGDNNCD